MTLAESKGRQPDTTLPRLQKSDYAILWADDFWDGVISGVLLHKDKEFWFDMIQENKTDDLKGGWYRRFAVVELRWPPKSGQGGSLRAKPSTIPRHVQETSYIQSRVQSPGRA